MSAPKGLKLQILQLRASGLVYNEIQKKLNCSKGTISYHCKINEATDIGTKQQNLSLQQKKQISEFCKFHSPKEASKVFKICISTVYKYRNFKS